MLTRNWNINVGIYRWNNSWQTELCCFCSTNFFYNFKINQVNSVKNSGISSILVAICRGIRLYPHNYVSYTCANRDGKKEFTKK